MTLRVLRGVLALQAPFRLAAPRAATLRHRRAVLSLAGRAGRVPRGDRRGHARGVSGAARARRSHDGDGRGVSRLPRRRAGAAASIATATCTRGRVCWRARPTGKVVQFGIMRINLQALVAGGARGDRERGHAAGADADSPQCAAACRIAPAVAKLSRGRCCGITCSWPATTPIYGRSARIVVEGRPAVELLEIPRACGHESRYSRKRAATVADARGIDCRFLMKPIADEYDCIVMGGGPAGSTVATLVAKAGFRTLLVERDRFPRRHVGESLMPDSYFVFERLGVLDKLKESGYAKKVGVQFVNHKGRESAPFLVPLERSARVQRDVARAAARVRPDAVRERGRARRRVPSGRAGAGRADGRRPRDGRAAAMPTDDDGSGGAREVRAKVVVDATGQQAILSHEAGPAAGESRPQEGGHLGPLPRRHRDTSSTAASTRSCSTRTSARAGSGTSRRPTTW